MSKPAAIYRSAVFLFSIACYGVFLLVFLHLLAFLGNLAPRSIDLPRGCRRDDGEARRCSS